MFEDLISFFPRNTKVFHKCAKIGQLKPRADQTLERFWHDTYTFTVIIKSEEILILLLVLKWHVRLEQIEGLKCMLFVHSRRHNLRDFPYGKTLFPTD